MIQKLRAGFLWLALTPAIFFGCGGQLEQDNQEVCNNQADDDFDGAVDCDDPDCDQDLVNCPDVPPNCGNGVIDAADGEVCDGTNLGGATCADLNPAFNSGTPTCSVDCSALQNGTCATVDICDGTLQDCLTDPLCANNAQCNGIENCVDGIDNDNDANVDCRDQDCIVGAPGICLENNTTNCSDGVDNDNDTLVDCQDPNCDPVPPCNNVAPEGNCTDGIDNNGDGLIDCQDSTCINDPACQVGVNADADCDGLSNTDEAALGTNAQDSDSDNDGLLDGIEAGVTGPVPGTNCPNIADADPTTTTNPNAVDSDGDGLADGAEDANLNGFAEAAESDATRLDTDGDLVNDGAEVSYGSSPVDTDTDNDGLNDGVENANQNGVKENNETNALSADTDCDALSDFAEVNGATVATDNDSDNDGVFDGVETGATVAVNGTNCVNVKVDLDPATTTNPNVQDSDNDGIVDGAEDRDQNGRVDANELNPNDTDSDNDLILDGIEDANRNGVKDSNETNGTLVDTDGDGIADGVEDANQNGVVNGGELNPRVTDTDGDTLPDNIEDANLNGVFDAGETNGTDADTDNDFLIDGIEDLDKDGVKDANESSPLLPDTDLDGLTDNIEDANQNGTQDANETATFSSDTDCDGLSDLFERSTSFTGGVKTNPLVADSDGDCLGDGQEIGATAVLANSGCATIPIDADPTSRTDPVTADTDGDARVDGCCEDGNRNGRLDNGELNPVSFDSDGDGLPDGVEDQNADCQVSAGETSGLDSDTDNDGIGDGVETNVTNTDPLDADTDGDQLLDGIEDQNQNGLVEPGETNPNDTDTDDDLILDGIEDSDHDGNLDAGETDPANVDTDGDALLDGFEDANQNGNLDANETDPLVVDTDGDGLDDGIEVNVTNTDPTVVDTDGDGFNDGDELLVGTNPLDPNDPGNGIDTEILEICQTDELKAINFFQDVGGLSQGGDWTIALESTGVPVNGNPGTNTPYTYLPVGVAGGDHAATFADQATTEVAGFVMDIAPPVANNTVATTQAQALIARLTSGTAALGAPANGVTTFLNGRQITSADQPISFQEVVDIQINITLTTATDPSTMRNRVMGVLANRALNQFTGLPGVSGVTSTTYVLRFSSLVRTGIPGINNTRIVVLGGVLSSAIFNNTARVEGLELKDLSNGTALASAFVGNTTVCNPFVASATPKADFIWMADTSGSTDNDRGNIVTASQAVFDALTANGVDFRMGVVRHPENDFAQGTGNGGDMVAPGFTTDRTTFSNILNVGGGDGCEYGILATSNAINKALPRTAPGVTNALKLRSDAKLVVFYISDETAQEVENQAGCNDATRFPLQTQTGQNNNARSVPPSAAQQANINTIVAPFITQIQNEQGIAFGQVTPIQAPFCADLESGEGYIEVVNGTGGTFYRTCDNNPGGVLVNIVDAVTGAASEFLLSDAPISSTIRVALIRTVAGTCDANNSSGCTLIDVPRSQTSGFDYDPAANTIFFRGATFRPNINDRVGISYRKYEQPQQPLVCNAPFVGVDNNGDGTIDSCECVADQGTNSCGVSGNGSTLFCASVAEACDTTTCSCECKSDCGGTVTDPRFECGAPTVCGPVCGDADNDGAVDCGQTCNGNFLCDTTQCACTCDATCNGAIQPGSNEVCDLNTCTATCPVNCGGCGPNETCDLDGTNPNNTQNIPCFCVDNGNG